MSPLVDTLQATRQLEKAGFATPQAEAIVTIVAHAGTRLATKADIERVTKDIEGLRTELTARMDTKIAEVRADVAEVRTDISGLRAELVAMMNKQASNHRMVMVAALGLLFVALRFT